MTQKTNFSLENRFLVKGDISGIQDFIFNIPSKGAAKILKGKSFYVSVLSELALEDIIKSCPKSQKVYDGGGNFYVLVDKNHKAFLDKRQKQYNEELRHTGLWLNLTYINYDTASSYAENLGNINKKAQYVSLNKFEFDTNSIHLFEPFSSRAENGENSSINNKFKDYSNWLTKSSDYKIENKAKGRGIPFLSQYYNFINSGEQKLSKNINSFVPKYEKADEDEFNALNLKDTDSFEPDSVMMFDFIAYHAKKRTGTGHLGILQLDVDNLGKIVRDRLSTIEENVEFSNQIDIFFKNNLFDIIKNGSFLHLAKGGKCQDKSKYFHTETYEIPYRRNIYPVFVGGDDCFLIGGWDAILEIISEIKKQFDAFIISNTVLKTFKKDLTFSVGVAIVDNRFPVNQFSKLSKEALLEAKKVEGKNHLNVFNTTLSWEQWEEIRSLRDILVKEIIEFNAPKGMLNRFKAGKQLFDQLQSSIISNKTIEFSLLYEFFYGLRDYNLKGKIPKTPVEIHKAEIVKLFVQKYVDLLSGTFIDGKLINSLIIPIAARWVELSIRNNKN